MKKHNSLCLFLLSLFAIVYFSSSFAFADPYMQIEPKSTGENIVVTDDGAAHVNVAIPRLYWEKEYLEFKSSASYTASFGLTCVPPGCGVGELGGNWRHTYSIQIIYTGTSLQLVTRKGTVIQFWFASGNTWTCNNFYGVYLTCVASPSGTFLLTDKYGNFIIFDARGLPTTIGDYYSWNTVFTNFNPAGLLTSVVDSTGRSMTLLYNGSSQLVSVIDNTVVGGGTSWLTINYSNNMISSIVKGFATGATLATDAFTYYTSGSTQGYLCTCTNPDGITTSFDYNASLFPATVTDAALNRYIFAYPGGNIVNVTDRNGLTLGYGVFPFLYSCIAFVNWPAPNATSPPTTEQYTYDLSRNCTYAYDRTGNGMTYTYDAMGNMLTANDLSALGYSWTWTYNSSNQMTSEVNPNGRKTTYQYNANGLLQAVIAADDNVATPTHPTLYFYNASFLVSQITSPNGFPTSYLYDGNNCLSSVVRTPDIINFFTTTYANDAWGRVTTETDAGGNVTIYSYNNVGYTSSVQVQYTATPTYSTTAYTYTGSGKISTVTDPLLNVTTYFYDSLGRHFATQHPTTPATITRTTFDAEGNVWGYEDAWVYNFNITNSTSFFTWYYSFDNWARVISTSKLFENTSTTPSTWVYQNDAYGYDFNDRVIQYTDYNGNTTVYDYDLLGRLVSKVDPLLNNEEWTYDNAGLVVDYMDKRGNHTSYVYDSVGRLTDEVASGSIIWTYDFNGNVQTVTDREGKITNYFYDGMDRLLITTNTNGAAIETLGYDALSRVTSRQDFYLNVWTTSYYPQGQVFQTIAPDSGTVTHYYDLAGNLTRTVDEVNSDTRYTYDALGRCTQMVRAFGQSYAVTTSTQYSLGRKTRDIDGVGNYTDYNFYCDGSVKSVDYYKPVTGSTHSINTYYYDGEGNIIEVNNPRGNSTYYDYDQLNRNYRIKYPSGNWPEQGFDANGNVSWYDDGLNNRTTYTYNAMNFCTAITDPAGNCITKTHDLMGHVLTVTVSPDGGVTNYTTTYTYTPLYKLETETDPLLNVHYNYYDVTGRQTGFQKKDGTTVSYSLYDSCGRLLEIQHPAPLDPLRWQTTVIGYDKCGRVIHYFSSDIEKGYVYDKLGRLTEETAFMYSWVGLTSLNANYTYDANDRISNVFDYFSSATTSYTYNDAALTKTIVEASARTHVYTYDAAGNLTNKLMANGMYETFTYDTSDRLTYQTLYSSGGTLLGSKSYTYDNADHITNDTCIGSYGSYSTVYSFDNRSNLTSEVRTGSNSYNKAYTYDGMGCRTQTVINGTTTSYTFNALGRIATAGGTAYLYDANGNLISDGNGFIMEYDWKNNLVYQNCGFAGYSEWFYAYDIGSVRIAKGAVTSVEGTPEDFADLSLKWAEFYHKSDNLDYQILDISLYDDGSQYQTDFTPVSLDSSTPYVGQLCLDPSDYEGLTYAEMYYNAADAFGAISAGYEHSTGNVSITQETDAWLNVESTSAAVGFSSGIYGRISEEFLKFHRYGLASLKSQSQSAQYEGIPFWTYPSGIDYWEEDKKVRPAGLNAPSVPNAAGDLKFPGASIRHDMFNPLIKWERHPGGPWEYGKHASAGRSTFTPSLSTWNNAEDVDALRGNSRLHTKSIFCTPYPEKDFGGIPGGVLSVHSSGDDWPWARKRDAFWKTGVTHIVSEKIGVPGVPANSWISGVNPSLNRGTFRTRFFRYGILSLVSVPE